MANEVHQKIDVSLTDFDFDSNFDEIDSVADGDIVWSAPVTTCEDCERAEVIAQITVGTTPTKGGTIEFYVGRAFNSIRTGTDDVTLTDHGENTDDDDVYALLGALGGPVAIISVDDETDTVYTKTFNIWYPTGDFQLFIYNNTGAALNAAGHDVSYRGWLPEAQ